MRLTYDEIKNEIKRVLIKYGLTEEKAELCAKIHTESTYDGIYSHGTGRGGTVCSIHKKRLG